MPKTKASPHQSSKPEKWHHYGRGEPLDPSISSNGKAVGGDQASGVWGVETETPAWSRATEALLLCKGVAGLEK